MIVQHAKSTAQATAVQSQKDMVQIAKEQLQLDHERLEFNKMKHDDEMEWKD